MRMTALVLLIAATLGGALAPRAATAACTVRLTVDVPQALRLPGRFVTFQVDSQPRVARNWDSVRLTGLGRPAGVLQGSHWMSIPYGPIPGNSAHGPVAAASYRAEIPGLGCSVQRRVRVRFWCGYMNPSFYGIRGNGYSYGTVTIAGGNLHQPRDMRITARC